MLDLAKQSNAQFILASSSEIYGDPEIMHHLDELLEEFQNQGRIRPLESKGPDTYRLMKKE